MKKRLSILALLLSISACATITGGKEQEIAISTNPAGAQCILTNGEDSWTLEKTPGVVTLPRAFQPITINCTLAGYAPVTMQLEPTTRGRAYGNILLGGVPAVVDTGTGAGYEYTPSTVVLEFKN